MERMFNPPHPGETLKEDVLPALGLTVTEAAQQLGVTRTALSRVLNGHAAISPEMARRIEAWLGPTAVVALTALAEAANGLQPLARSTTPCTESYTGT
jgi:addiction module HigA family antidote